MCTSPVPYAMPIGGSVGIADKIYLDSSFLAFRGKPYINPNNHLHRYIIQTHPCGGCLHCRIARSRDWAVRAYHELQVWDYCSSFLTLTYAPEHVPVVVDDVYTLDPEHLRKFHRDLKEYLIENVTIARCRSIVGQPVYTHLSCGEYGERFGRPHYHACLFGVEFTDRVLDFVSPCGENVYRSRLLEELWPYGRCAIGSVTWESAAYVARYITKKITGDAADDHYGVDVYDDQTGEIWASGSRLPEFVDCSRKHALGKYWFSKYAQSDLIPNDNIIIDNRRFPVPRYYDKLLERHFPDAFSVLKAARLDKLDASLHDFTLERLDARRLILQQRFSKLERSYENV